MKPPIRIFSLSHSCVVPEYRLRQAYVAEREHIELTLLTPEVWNQFNTPCVSPEKNPAHRYRLIRQQPIAWGLKNHGLRNASHVYRNLGRLIADCQPDILELWEEPFFAVSWQAARHFLRQNPQGKILFFSAQNVAKRRPPPYTWFEKYLFKRAQVCVAMNAEVPEVLKAKGWRGQNLILPLGLDPNKYAKAFSGNTERKLPGCVIGFLGKLTEQKGISDLLAAMEMIAGSGVKASLLVVGAGEMKEKISRRLAALPLPNLLLDSVTHDEVPQALAQMDVVVMPSWTMPGLKEQFGRVAAEAMAAKRTVVVSDSGELPNVVGEGGVVFPERNPSALAAALRKLIDDPVYRQQLAAAGHARALDKYSWKVIADRQVALYEELIEC
jgi:glycosyltransferase involved in cell wall biosynthesis